MVCSPAILRTAVFQNPGRVEVSEGFGGHRNFLEIEARW